MDYQVKRFLSNNLDTLENSGEFVYMSSRFTELMQFANEIDVVLKFFDLGMINKRLL
jgi:hypothetical protein